MRNRLIASFVGLTALVIALYGVPRAYFLADLVQAQEQRKIERTVDLVEVVIVDRLERGSPVTPDLLAELVHEEERLDYLPAQGTAVGAGDSGPPSATSIRTSRVLADGSQITLSRSGALVSERISDALLPLVLLGMGLLTLAAVVAFWLSQRLARPFQELADAAHHLGTGDFDLSVPHYDIPEAELIGIALQESARRLETLVRRERDFTVQASHVLRTPITALRLELEDVALWPHTPSDVAAQLTSSIAELDRLSTAVTGLLSASREQSSDEATTFDLQVEVRSLVEARVAAQDSSQTPRVIHRPADSLEVTLPLPPVRRAVNLLLDALLVEGPGTIILEIVDRGSHAVLRLVREAPATPGAPSQGPLTEARELVASLGGTVVRMSPPDHGLELMLPYPRQPG